MVSEIIKRDGTKENLSDKKLERSIKDSGASAETTKKVLDKIMIEDGMTSDDIRMEVSQHLERMDEAASDRYNRQRRLTLYRSNEVNNGTILINKATMTDLEIIPGEQIDLVLGTGMKSFEVGRSDMKSPGVYLNDRDLRSLNIDEGNRVIVQKRSK